MASRARPSPGRRRTRGRPVTASVLSETTWTHARNVRLLEFLTVAVGASVSASVSLQRVRATHSPLPRSR